MSMLVSVAASLLFAAIINAANAADLVLVGAAQSQTLGGVRTYDTVSITGGAILSVPFFDGSDPVNTGNLEITCNSLTVGSGSKITARGAGFQMARVCDDGVAFPGNADYPPAKNAGGGCSVMDSGGGGGHGGRGGPGTKDCVAVGGVSNCTFPDDYEERCMSTRDSSPCDTANCCTEPIPNATFGGRANCRDKDGYGIDGSGLPDTYGLEYQHNVFDSTNGAGFGGSGGDKGCRDGDGYCTTCTGPVQWPKQFTAGHGGGRILINCTTITIEDGGQINADGHRGCGNGNDSGGGGAGGTIVLVALNQLNVLGNADSISARGGWGGDTKAKDLVEYPECTQTQLDNSGVCDDCGGGGGGGLVYIMATAGDLQNATDAVLNLYDPRVVVEGGLGGICEACQSESAGAGGRVFFNDGTTTQGYQEFCDGVDNNFDGIIDKILNADGTISEFPPLDCGTPSAPFQIPSCVNGLKPKCPSTTGTTGTTGTPATTTAVAEAITSSTATATPTSTASSTGIIGITSTTSAGSTGLSAGSSSGTASSSGVSPGTGDPASVSSACRGTLCAVWLSLLMFFGMREFN